MRIRLATPFLILSLAAAAACTGHVRIYDEPRHDYHQWDKHEDQVYRVYLTENHREYRDFHTLSPKEQNDYWEWRHHHEDR